MWYSGITKIEQGVPRTDLGIIVVLASSHPVARPSLIMPWSWLSVRFFLDAGLTLPKPTTKLEKVSARGKMFSSLGLRSALGADVCYTN
jgi:hypothetical protein